MMREKLFDVLRSPLVTEKTARANQENQYAFRVATTATKAEIKAAVEQLFSVNVLAVQTLNVAGKARRFRIWARRTKPVWLSKELNHGIENCKTNLPGSSFGHRDRSFAPL
ncbi:MAG: 50S ribosomal protein L23 [Halothiobacillus sp. 14-56-357]|nr:MAG: 50S ribosomal protein L23 [Halothiobacillus sp. 14-56-357]